MGDRVRWPLGGGNVGLAERGPSQPLHTGSRPTGSRAPSRRGMTVNRTTNNANTQESGPGLGPAGTQNGHPSAAVASGTVNATRAPQARGRVGVDGKFFAVGDEQFPFRGVTYGTFAPRGDGARFPERTGIERDLRMMREAGFTVVRTYTLPPEDLLEAAAEHGLRILAGVFYPDWRYLLGGSRREQRRVAREAGRGGRATRARLLAGDERVLGAVARQRGPGGRPALVRQRTGRRHDPRAGRGRARGGPRAARHLRELPDRRVPAAREPRLPHVQRLPRAQDRLPPLPHPACTTSPATGRSSWARSGSSAEPDAGGRGPPGGGARLAARDRARARRGGDLRLLLDRRLVGRRRARSRAGASASRAPTARRGRRSRWRRAGTSARCATSSSSGRRSAS